MQIKFRQKCNTVLHDPVVLNLICIQLPDEYRVPHTKSNLMVWPTVLPEQHKKISKVILKYTHHKEPVLFTDNWV